MGNSATLRLRGMERRFDRAHDHAKAAEQAINAYIANGPTSLATVPQRKAAEYELRVVQPEPPDLLAWGLRIGDAVHNLRSILDAAVWHLAIKRSGSDPPPNPSRVEFPIFEDRDLFGKRGTLSIESISDPARTIIEQAQPYHRRNAPDYEPLWVLHKFNNVDKHRVIAPVLVESESFSLIDKHQGQ